MTSLYSSPQSPDPAPSKSAAPDAIRPPASEVVKQEHADERWRQGVVSAANQSAVGRRSGVIIGSVIAVGVLAWLIVTML